MFARHSGIRAVQTLVLAGVVIGAGGCAAKVKKEDFNNEMARIREEIASGDRQVGTRVDSTNMALADQNKRINALDQELKTFRSEYQTSIEKMQSMLKFSVPVHFDFAQADVRETDHAVLDRFASVVQKFYPGAVITVEGFTDPAGSAAYNKRLGQQRADAVKNYLASNAGLDGSTIKTVSYGEARDRQVVPGASGPGEAGMPNRRVVLVIDHEKVAGDNLAMQQ